MTKQTSKILGAALVLYGTAVVATPAIAASVMSGDQIRSEIIDRMFAYRGEENGQRKKGTIRYTANGKIKIRTRKGFQDSGVWKIDRQGKLCTRITLGRGNQLKCFSIFEAKNGKYATDHGYFLYPVED